ncbi:thiamine phosphate synthase [uncultured Hyphomonas sp.]|jgi:thiamine-phosphate pyrophosphorylase|uniref:thiamine phosphate synthase n=1 Tax=uncultured Hyphomonas sp. TaxID=225298 RepID=UPI000C5F2585|nr:thiamine phosphate synthase [Hyphomonadaceae bacterium]|tara:strand:+ start:27105 stop:27728 length:624 start_codon:yes stop_codon:yes gene_type:complete
MAQKPQDEARRKLISAARRAGRHLPSWLPPALFLTDPQRTPDPVSIAEHLPAGWGIIYRHYGAAHRLWQARQLADIANRRGLALLISADPGLAIKVGAAGVHWPFSQKDKARKWQGRFDLMSVSAHGHGELRQIDAHIFDAALVSAVFPSKSPSAGSPLGAFALRSLSKHSPVPLYGLGGVNSHNASSICNAAGLAAIEGIRDPFRS